MQCARRHDSLLTYKVSSMSSFVVGTYGDYILTLCCPDQQTSTPKQNVHDFKTNKVLPIVIKSNGEMIGEGGRLITQTTHRIEQSIRRKKITIS